MGTVMVYQLCSMCACVLDVSVHVQATVCNVLLNSASAF